MASASASARPRKAIVSGYVNPIHPGHLEYFRQSKELVGPDGTLLVIVNSDAQSVLKKGYSFMPEQERLQIVSALRDVNEAVLSIDTDRTVCGTIRMLFATGRIQPGDVFCNGGDALLGNNVPEVPVCRELGIDLVDGLGAKIQSSSWLIEGAITGAAAAAATTSC